MASSHWTALLCRGLLVGAVALATAFGQEPDSEAEAGAAPAVEDLSEVLEVVLNRFDVPALGCALVRDGQLVGLGAAGVRVSGRKEEVTTDDLWHLGSCTKAMTATLCGRMVARGELEWDTTLQEAFGDIEVHEDLAEATLAQLLSHNSGLMTNPLPVWMALRQHEGPVTAARAMMVEKMLVLRPPALSGTGFSYSNTGYMVVGAWLEKQTGKSWEQLMRDELFGPLGMGSAGFGPPGIAVEDGEAEEAPTQPWGHGEDGRPVAPGPLADNPPALGPAGTVHSTLADWARFLVAHMDPAPASEDGAEQPFLSDDLRTYLHTSPNDGGSYAMGFGVLDLPWAKGPVLQHAGSNTMWFSFHQVVPSERFGILVTCNQGSPAARSACEAVSAALLRREGRR